MYNLRKIVISIQKYTLMFMKKYDTMEKYICLDDIGKEPLKDYDAESILPIHENLCKFRMCRE